jgi:sec-independent protein translocase protein TatA
VNLPSGWELVLVLLVVVLVFGSKRLPDSARSLGRSLRIFKAETKGLRGDDANDDAPVESRRETTDGTTS